MKTRKTDTEYRTVKDEDHFSEEDLIETDDDDFIIYKGSEYYDNV